MTREEMGKAILGEYASMMAFAMRLASNKADAEDLVQSTVLKALEKVGDYRGGSVKSWLNTILYHDFLNMEERRKECTDADIESSDDDYSSDEPSYDLPNVTIDEIRGLLSEKKMRALMLYANGYLYREIEKEMGETLSNVKKLIHDGRAILARYY